MRRLIIALASLPVVLGTPTVAAELPDACQPGPSGVVTPGCVPAVLGGVRDVVRPGWTLPDLVPTVPDADVGYYYYQQPDGTWITSPRLVRFSVAVKNNGVVPLDVLGDPSTDLMSTTVQQCVSWTERACRERARVGGFAWHPEHNHFHFQDFATYELRRLDPAGGVDWSTAGLVDIALKVSFCLMDTVAADDDAPPPFYVQCLGFNQGISPSWADVYARQLNGQGLSIEGLPDGFYAIVVRLDPSSRLLEADDGNNETAVVVEISDGGQAARIVGPAG